MKICAYIQDAYSKQNYKNESFNTRQFVGLRVVIDALEKGGHKVDYAGTATVHEYDIILISITSDCDWWTFIAERVRWRCGKYKVIVGGAGVLNVRPFLDYADFFILGRGENVICDVVDSIVSHGELKHESVITPSTFDVDSKYKIMQADRPYPSKFKIDGNKSVYEETFIGCNHKCLFCGYTWHRKYIGDGEYKMPLGLFEMENKERALLDMKKDYSKINFSRLRTTAIDGFSERLRFMVQKKITKQDLIDFLVAVRTSEAKPHQIKLYNLVGLPTETEEDWFEFTDCLAAADGGNKSKHWSILLHSTPFRPMPATPAACWAMSLNNYRGEIARKLKKDKTLVGNVFYSGNNFFAVESMGTESLPTVILSAIVWRGTEQDADNARKIACSKSFWGASTAVKTATLKHYFDVETLFNEFTHETLPTRYLTTYAKVERCWETKC